MTGRHSGTLAREDRSEGLTLSRDERKGVASRVSVCGVSTSGRGTTSTEAEVAGQAENSSRAAAGKGAQAKDGQRGSSRPW